jgi:hypothetical protein
MRYNRGITATLKSFEPPKKPFMEYVLNSFKWYKSYFQEEYGNVACKESGHPKKDELLSDYLPLTNEQQAHHHFF